MYKVENWQSDISDNSSVNVVYGDALIVVIREEISFNEDKRCFERRNKGRKFRYV